MVESPSGRGELRSIYTYIHIVPYQRDPRWCSWDCRPSKVTGGSCCCCKIGCLGLMGPDSMLGERWLILEPARSYTHQQSLVQACFCHKGFPDPHRVMLYVCRKNSRQRHRGTVRNNLQNSRRVSVCGERPTDTYTGRHHTALAKSQRWGGWLARIAHHNHHTREHTHTHRGKYTHMLQSRAVQP